jgi:CBS domain containing-hemolysin-like protein
MDDIFSYVTQITTILGLALANGIFAAAEYAIVSASEARLRSSEDGSRRRTKAALWLIDRLDRSLSATQVGITVSTLLLGWVATRLALSKSTGLLIHVVPNAEPNTVIVLSMLLGLGAVVLCHVGLGELVAKSIALRYPEQTLRVLAGPLFLFVQLCRPFSFVSVGLANLVLRPFGTSVPATFDRVQSIADLSALVSHGGETGAFDEDEHNMLRGVVGFSETVAREVMTPRTDLASIEAEASLPEVLRTIVDSGFSRFPVRGSDIDDIKGILLVKDLLPTLAKGQGADNSRFVLERVLREPYFIPGTKPIDDLLNEFKQRKLHMAIVLDEHGGVDGVVTLEDLLEEIVGDIYDESDIPETDASYGEDGALVVDGGILVTDLNERFGFTIPEGHYDTIAGFIFTSLGRIPERGDYVWISADGEISQLYDENGVLLALPDENTREGGGLSENGNNADSASQVTDFIPEIRVVVDKMEAHRIESVRMERLESDEQSEPQSEYEASHLGKAETQ